jgi:hypothetical protein
MPTTKLRKARADKGIKRALRKMAPEDALAILKNQEETAEEQIVETKERVPGQVVGGLKTSWTRKDIETRFPIVEFLSEENIVITWNGVPYQLLQGATHYLPSVIRDAYLNHRRELRTSKTLPEDRGFTNIIDLGTGALPPE